MQPAAVQEHRAEERGGLQPRRDDAVGAHEHLEVRRGAGAYICGEETAMLESLEGKRAQPRNKPPFPVVEGLFGKPTVVNNVETLCDVKHILAMGGGAEYAKLGKPNNTGTRIFCVSGHVQKPGYYEFEAGKITMGQLLNDVCGGPLPGSLPTGARTIFEEGLIIPPTRLDENVLDDMQTVRASGITFAPEAGSQRMRDVVNKNVTEEQLMTTAERVFAWTPAGVRA